MRRRLACFAVLLAWFGGFVPDVRAAHPLPASPTPHYIRDDAKWLGPGAFHSLDAKLQAFERESSSQIVVAIFPQIPEGEELFDFSQRLFEAWKPGQKGKDNGALFLVFAADRKMRIHTGFGMEGVLPDARCKQIIEDVVAPQLRQGNREAAINAGVDAMIAAAKGEYKGTGRTRLDHGSEINLPPLVVNLLVILVFLLFKYLHWRFYGRYRPGASETWYSGGSSGGGWSGGGGGGSSGGGFSGGGGGGSSGGGFSGGGGDSGGGGSSGSW